MEATKKPLEDTSNKLNEDIANAQHDIADLCHTYGEIAITGSFGGYYQSIIQVLEVHLKMKQKEVVPAEEITQLKELLEKMNVKYKIVRDSEKKK
jgi:hypothetical protein